MPYERDWEEDADVEAQGGCLCFPCNPRGMAPNDLCPECRAEFEAWLNSIEEDFELNQVPPFAPEEEIGPLEIIEMEERQRKPPAQQPAQERKAS
jgi:hypothetical protein